MDPKIWRRFAGMGEDGLYDIRPKINPAEIMKIIAKKQRKNRKLTVNKAKQFLANLVQKDNQLERLFIISRLYNYDMKIHIE